jgi:hypothetical protein
MKFPHRRQFLNLAAGATTLPAVSRVAMAQTYPTKPVVIVVGSGGVGTAQHVAGELFKMMTGVNMVHVCRIAAVLRQYPTCSAVSCR